MTTKAAAGMKYFYITLTLTGLILSFFGGYQKRVKDENKDMDLKITVSVQKVFLDMQKGALLECHHNNILLLNKLETK